jgi:TolB-like protein/tetratricopeptide (TPR) repeat protein
MASTIPGYEYDIFISYRQKDNKGDRWVSEFVDALKTELESTFKEEISVYFDINPHDGLLETHDVDASLKDKLKCLIFIPIISKTYCDPKSFAWEHEFKAFIEYASKDHFGLKVKLPNGNVANRILPVQIHDLYPEDKTLLERELSGVLRAIEFIYKEPGVNRTLTSKDNEEKNSNKTNYRNQINKVSNAIDEIIRGLKCILTAPLKDETRQNKLSVEAKKEDERKEQIINAIFRQKSKKRLIMLLLMFLFVLGAFAIIKIIDNSKQTQALTKLEKSIAVLPFRNDSPDQENTYFINGIMEEVLNNLQKIKGFRVLSRTSTEQYRGSAKLSIPKIAKELNVNYIVEGSGQKYGNSYRLRVQLITGKNERHLWGDSYEKEVRETKDIYGTQSEIAQSIASALKATMTPEEKQLIEKTPTANLTAYDFYQRGRDELTKYWINNDNKTALGKASDFFHKALEYDSAFAQAYTGLAWVYWNKHYWSEYFSENFQDSTLSLTNIALSFDDQLSEAYTLKGTYYSETGKREQTIEEFDKAIKFNPNDWMAYSGKGKLYYGIDYVNVINYLQKAASLNHGPLLPALLSDIGYAYFGTGFPEKSRYYFQETLKLDGDSLRYYSRLATVEYWLGNFNKSIEFAKKGYVIDSTDEEILEYLADNYEGLGQYEESFKYYKKYVEKLKLLGNLTISGMQRIGYVYWKNDYKAEADHYFNEQKRYCEESIKLGRTYAKRLGAYYDLAGVYAFMGEKKKAYKNLRIYSQIQQVPLWMVNLIKRDPLLNSIRNEPEFQQIVRDVEAKYQAEHERVRKWLEGQGTL